MFPLIVNFKQMIYSRLISAIFTSICLKSVFFMAIIFVMNLQNIKQRSNNLEIIFESFHWRLWLISIIVTSIKGTFTGKELLNLKYEKRSMSRISVIVRSLSFNNWLTLLLEMIFGYIVYEEFQVMFGNYEIDTVFFRYFVLYIIAYIMYARDNSLEFSMINEPKIRRFTNALKTLFGNSLKLCLLLSFTYFLLYNILRERIIFMNDFSIFNIGNKLFLIYCFANYYLVSRKIIDICFGIFLTQHWIFPVVDLSTPSNAFSVLSYGFNDRFLSLIQHLASHDFCLMAYFDEDRQNYLFYKSDMNLSSGNLLNDNWKIIVNDVLSIFVDFTNELENIYDQFNNVTNHNSSYNKNISSNMSTINYKLKDVTPGMNLRNMSMKGVSNVDLVHLSSNGKNLENNSSVNDDHSFKQIFGNLFFQNTLYKFVFKDRPYLKFQYLLRNNKPIIWLINGLVELMVCSLTKDKHGVVSQDFNRILKSLKELKIQIEKVTKSISLKKLSNEYVSLNNELLSTLNRNFFKINKLIAIHDPSYYTEISSSTVDFSKVRYFE